MSISRGDAVEERAGLPSREHSKIQEMISEEMLSRQEPVCRVENIQGKGFRQEILWGKESQEQIKSSAQQHRSGEAAILLDRGGGHSQRRKVGKPSHLPSVANETFCAATAYNSGFTHRSSLCSSLGAWSIPALSRWLLKGRGATAVPSRVCPCAQPFASVTSVACATAAPLLRVRKPAGR